MSVRITFDTWADDYASRIDGMRTSAVRDLFGAASRDDVISLSGGMPDVRLVPTKEVADAAHKAILETGTVALQYGSTEGRVEVRALVGELMGEIGIRVKPADVIMTAGAQEALDILAKTFIDPGDTIICEGPTYLGALQAFTAYQPNIVCIPLDDEGMRTDLLEEELRRLGKKGAKFIYTIPNFQNPGGVTMSAERRRRLVELSKEYEILLVEDDPYGRLRFEGGHQLPLRSLDEDVVYLGTFSKIFGPGLRLGWVVAPPPIIERFSMVKQGSDLSGSPFTQVVVEEYFATSDWHKTVQKQTLAYHQRRDAMLEALEEFFPSEATWTHPEGGFFIWVTLPTYVDTAAMLPEALECGVTYVPGDGFFPDGRGRNSMRIAFCYEAPEDLREAVRRLGEVIESKLEMYRAFIEAGAILPASALEVGKKSKTTSTRGDSDGA